MALTTDITAANWQHSLTSGEIVQGNDELRQALVLILSTDKGSDPLRPDFGVSAYQYLGAPGIVAIGTIRRDIVQQVATFEPRIEILQVRQTFSADTSQLTITVEWKPTGTTNNDTITIVYG